MKFKIALANGGIREVEGRKFAHYIGNIRYWFFYHESAAIIGLLTVSHYESGLRVCDVPYMIRMGAGDDKAAAKRALDKLIAQHGAEKVRHVIDTCKTKEYQA